MYRQRTVTIAVVRKIGESKPVLAFRPAESISDAHAHAATLANEPEILGAAVVIWEPINGIQLTQEYKSKTESFRSITLFASRLGVDHEVAKDIEADQAYQMAYQFTGAE